MSHTPINDLTAIRAQMEALEGFTPGPWTWKNDVNDEYSEWSVSPGVLLADGPDGTPSGDEIDRANARLIAAAPEMHSTITAMADALDAATARAEAAEAEVGRLREALTVIAEWGEQADDYEAIDGRKHTAFIARAALNASSQEGGE